MKKIQVPALESITASALKGSTWDSLAGWRHWENPKEAEDPEPSDSEGFISPVE